MRPITHLAALVPVMWLIYDYLTNSFTANPIQDITHRTGKAALIMLTLTLSVTVIRRMAPRLKIHPLRRILGLYTFFYATLHLTTFVALDFFFDWRLIAREISEKRYVLVGFSAWLLLLPLAITSTKGWQRRLGRKWRKLHRLIYLIAPLVIFHYVWLVKSDYREPLAYGAVMALLLVGRKWSRKAE